MLTCLRVRNFAIIDELEVDLGPGLNVLTGETGAGKSILVDALELVLGARGRPEVVRTGESAAEVEALFDPSDDLAVLERLAAAGLDGDQELVIRRVVQASGRSRAYVNGRMATAAQLRRLAAGLADISSQHEHHTLADPTRHLGFLDAFAQLLPVRAEVEKAHAELMEASRAIAELEELVRHRIERQDLLRYQIGEIEALAPEPGEDETLAEERNRLRHAEQLARTAGGAEETLHAADDAVCALLSRIGTELQEAAKLDPALAPLRAQVEEARTTLEDAARELGSYARTVTTDTERLTEVDDRLAALRHISRKYGGSLEEAIAHRERAEHELDELDRHEERAGALTAARDAALERARDLARQLSARRKKAASKLGKAISDELSSLGMGDAVVKVDVAPLPAADRDDAIQIDGGRLGPSGIDRVEFLIAPNRGEEARPLRKIASGGELSRALLAIKRVLAGLGPAGVYVFDEVDAGVGGAVAEVIGRKLHDVARHRQVLCVTHLPQIAVFADTHLYVEKSVASGRTHSTVRRLDDRQRLDEVARMLGGVKITTKTRAAAAELIKHARS